MPHPIPIGVRGMMKNALMLVLIGLLMFFMAMDSYHQRVLYSNVATVPCLEDPGLREIKFETGMTLVLAADSPGLLGMAKKQSAPSIKDVLAVQDIKKKFFIR